MWPPIFIRSMTPEALAGWPPPVFDPAGPYAGSIATLSWVLVAMAILVLIIVLAALWAALFGLAGGGVVAAAIALAGGASMRRAVTANVHASLATMTAPVAPRRAKRHTVPLAVPLAAAAVTAFALQGGM